MGFNGERSGWDATFMRIAAEMGQHSTCARWKVGAVLVKDNRVLSTGYNGVPSGHKHCIDVVRDEVKDALRTFFHARNMRTVDDVITLGMFGERYAVDMGWIRVGGTALSARDFATTDSAVDKLTDPVTKLALERGWLSAWHSEWSAEHELHAEVNCIAWAAREGIKTKGSTMYVTLSPCVHCAKAIVAAGVEHVVYGGEVRSEKKDDGTKLLFECGVAPRRLAKDEH